MARDPLPNGGTHGKRFRRWLRLCDMQGTLIGLAQELAQPHAP